MPKPRKSLNWLLVPAVLAAAAAGAQTSPTLTKEELAGKLNGVSPSDISDAPIPGLYQVMVGSQVAYVTKDGLYIFRGDIYDVRANANLTESARSEARVSMLANVARDDMIVFAPKDGKVKHTITIFTDIDCGYCRQFHRDIDKVTALGIEVHYLFYPRSGRDSDSWDKAEEVWCAADRNSALTRAKAGASLPDAQCGATPVDAHYELGRAVGVRGTPSVFDKAGEMIGGYLPPNLLLQVLDGDITVESAVSSIEE